MMSPNDRATLRGRHDAGTLTWRNSLLMLFARSVCAVAAQGLVAGHLSVTVVADSMA